MHVTRCRKIFSFNLFFTEKPSWNNLLHKYIQWSWSSNYVSTVSKGWLSPPKEVDWNTGFWTSESPSPYFLSDLIRNILPSQPQFLKVHDKGLFQAQTLSSVAWSEPYRMTLPDARTLLDFHCLRVPISYQIWQEIWDLVTLYNTDGRQISAGLWRNSVCVYQTQLLKSPGLFGCLNRPGRILWTPLHFLLSNRSHNIYKRTTNTIPPLHSLIWDWSIRSFFGKRPKALPQTRCTSVLRGSGLNVAENSFTRTIIRSKLKTFVQQLGWRNSEKSDLSQFLIKLCRTK